MDKIEYAYKDFDSFISEMRRRLERELIELYRSNSDLVCCASLNVVTVDDLSKIIELAFEAGRLERGER